MAFHSRVELFECNGRLTVHHVKETPGAQKNDRRTIPLCEAHHMHDFGPYSIERIGKAAFEKRYGLKLEQLIVYYNEAYGK